MALDGVAKKRMATSRLQMVNVEYETSKNPDPRECIIGGLMKIETKRMTHQIKVMARKMTQRYRKALTLHRLYGET